MNQAERTCYYCHSVRSTYYAEENGFELFRCEGCGLIFLKDIPDEVRISEAHRQGKHQGVNELDATGVFSEAKIPVYQNVLRDLFGSGMKPIGSWLDVGCGHGEFLVALDRFSDGQVVARGTEPNIQKQESARARGLDVGYFNLESHGEKYDAISLLNVYSHLPDPPSFLSQVRDLLNPGGELVLQTGDTAHLSPEDHYRPFYLPDHLSFASENIVTNMVANLGFELVKICKYPYPNLYRPSFGISMLKEAAKMMLPRYNSNMKQYISYFRHRNMYAQTDMYIRARLA